jgi:hypothetical protein
MIGILVFEDARARLLKNGLGMILSIIAPSIYV